ncbi:MAG: hypothetical protein HKL79_05155 [Thermoplasmata archaeon]|nr:hypothetical protein [Thermoplasmata archaeon]
MRGLSLVAIGSLGGFILCVIVYSFDPVPGSWTSSTWTNPGVWLAIVILGAGLVCFVVGLIAGLISVLNWGTDRPRGRNGNL